MNRRTLLITQLLLALSACAALVAWGVGTVTLNSGGPTVSQVKPFTVQVSEPFGAHADRDLPR